LGEEIQAVILGIGINVASESVPSEDTVDFPATCVEFHASEPVDRLQLLKEVLNQILRWIDFVSETKFLSTWQNKLAYMGEHVQIFHKDKAAHEGKVIGLDRNGGLILQSRQKEEVILQTGEIHLRPLIDK
jgi:biotin-(acetyl-CoA carboxylase) ligase